MSGKELMQCGFKSGNSDNEKIKDEPLQSLWLKEECPV